MPKTKTELSNKCKIAFLEWLEDNRFTLVTENELLELAWEAALVWYHNKEK